jgi:hypothetical protein
MSQCVTYLLAAVTTVVMCGTEDGLVAHRRDGPTGL